MSDVDATYAQALDYRGQVRVAQRRVAGLASEPVPIPGEDSPRWERLIEAAQMLLRAAEVYRAADVGYRRAKDSAAVEAANIKARG